MDSVHRTPRAVQTLLTLDSVRCRARPGRTARSLRYDVGVTLWDGDSRRRTGALVGTADTTSEGTPEAVGALTCSTDGGTFAVGGSGGSTPGGSASRSVLKPVVWREATPPAGPRGRA